MNKSVNFLRNKNALTKEILRLHFLQNMDAAKIAITLEIRRPIVNDVISKEKKLGLLNNNHQFRNI